MHPGAELRQSQTYYNPALNRARLQQLEATADRTGTSFKLIEADLEKSSAVEAANAAHKPSKLVNLPAQAGVRYLIENIVACIPRESAGLWPLS